MNLPAEHDIAPLSPTDFHALLVLADGPLYGYGIMKAMAEESKGAVAPEIGSLYRTLARLVSRGWIEEADNPREDDAHPGRERRYFRLSASGREVLATEAARLREALVLAEKRDLLIDPGT